MLASIWTSSSNSMRATLIPVCMAMMTVLTALARSGNWQTADWIASGTPYRRNWISVMTPSVPSAPTKSRVRS